MVPSTISYGSGAVRRTNMPFREGMPKFNQRRGKAPLCGAERSGVGVETDGFDRGLCHVLVATTALPVEDVAAAAGFGSATLLRQHLRSALGLAPPTYRRTFRPPAAIAA